MSAQPESNPLPVEEPAAAVAVAAPEAPMELDPLPLTASYAQELEEWNAEDKEMKASMRGYIKSLREYSEHPETAAVMLDDTRLLVGLLKERMDLHQLVKPTAPPPGQSIKLRSADDLICNLDRAVNKIGTFTPERRRQPELFWRNVMNVCQVMNFGARELPQVFLLLFKESEDMAWTQMLVEQKC
jgi:hypothetical protein